MMEMYKYEAKPEPRRRVFRLLGWDWNEMEMLANMGGTISHAGSIIWGVGGSQMPVLTVILWLALATGRGAVTSAEYDTAT